MTEPLTPAEQIVKYLRAQGTGITRRVADMVIKEIDKALAEAERRGMLRAAEMLRRTAHTGYQKTGALLDVADELER